MSSPSALISVRSAVRRIATAGPVVSRFSGEHNFAVFGATRLDRAGLVLDLPLDVAQMRNLLAARL